MERAPKNALSETIYRDDYKVIFINYILFIPFDLTYLYVSMY